MSEKVKKGFKLPSSYTILMLIIAFMAVMTWIIPAGQYEKTKLENLSQAPIKQWLKIRREFGIF